MGENHSEAVARRVLEMAIPGARMNFHCEQSCGEYDFDLHYPNGEIAAVEVTSSRNQALTQIHAEIFSERNGGPSIPAKLCHKSWFIFPARNAGMKRIRLAADSYLADIEAAEIESFDCFDCWGDKCHASVVKICSELKLTGGAVISSSGSPQIHIGGVVSGGAVGPTSATDAGEREIEPNRAKLGKAKTKERHLVVYIDQLNGLAFTALTSFAPPPELPKLPIEITHIWLITEVEKDQFVAWYGSSTEPWRTSHFSETPQTDSRGELE